MQPKSYATVAPAKVELAKLRESTLEMLRNVTVLERGFDEFDNDAVPVHVTLWLMHKTSKDIHGQVDSMCFPDDDDEDDFKPGRPKPVRHKRGLKAEMKPKRKVKSKPKIQK